MSQGKTYQPISNVAYGATPEEAHANYLAMLADAQAQAKSGPPSLMTKAGTFLGALYHHVAAGSPTLSPEQTEARLAICRPCDQYDEGSCKICGCNLAIKASWADMSCPLDPPKWAAVKHSGS